MGLRAGIFAAITAAALGASVSAAAAEASASNPDSVLQALLEYGYTAKMEKAENGDPKITSRVSKTQFSVYFFGCEDGIKCKSIMISAGYDMDEGITALKINEWNRDKLFGKGYIDDDGDPFLEMDINLDFDGPGDKNFDDTLDWWRLVVEEFERFIDW